jgi:hypothetical protein
MIQKGAKVEYLTNFTCDGCKAKRKITHESPSDPPLPPGWHKTGKDNHLCAKCKGREDDRQSQLANSDS